VAEASLFDRFVSALFGEGSQTDEAEERLVAQLVELVVDTVEPKLRLNRKYRKRLDPGVRATMAWLREAAKAPLEPLVLTRANWSADARLAAFFASPDDIPAVLGRSTALRKFFEENAAAAEACALLGMKREDKSILDAQDVAKITTDFSGHKVVAPSADETGTRLAVGRLVFQKLAQAALGRILELERQGTDLEQRKAYLGTLLRVLKLARDADGLVEDPAGLEEKIRLAERELEQAVRGFIDAKGSIATLDAILERIAEVFEHPQDHVSLARGELRLDRMNIQDQAAEALSLVELRVGTGVQAVVALVRVPRTELPPRVDLLANAERFL
jgi:hypothetical protein